MGAVCGERGSGCCRERGSWVLLAWWKGELYVASEAGSGGHISDRMDSKSGLSYQY